MKLLATLAALLISAGAQAAPPERCYQMAGMYMLSFNLRDLAISDAERLGATMSFAGFSIAERQASIERTRPTGDLGHLSARTIYSHVLLACGSAR